MITHRPFIFVALFFMIGIILEKYFHLPFHWLGGFAILSLVLGLCFLQKKIVSSILVSFFLIFLGALFLQNHLSLSKDHINFIKWYERKGPVEIEGIVISDVQKRSYFKGLKTVFTVEVKRYKTNWGWRPRSGLVLVNVFRDSKVDYGDYLYLKGKLHRPFNYSPDSHFSYRDYLEQRGIKYLLSVGKEGSSSVLDSGHGRWWEDLSLRTKHRLNKILTDHLSPNEAALVIGMVLGDRYTIPQHIRDLFVQTGTAHILAISGFNVGIVAFLIFLVLKTIPIGRRNQYLATIFLLIAYSFLVGGQPAVVRATIMAVVFLLSFLVERETDTTNSLAFAALIILMDNPLNFFDIGFQLSFISVLSIIQFYPRIFQWLSKCPFDINRQPILFVAQSLSVSLAAEFGIAALIAYYFNIITPVTILANLIIIPLMSAIVALGLGLLLAGLIWPGCAFVFVACIKLVLNITVGMIYLFSQLPGAYFYVQSVSFWQVFIYYFFVIFSFCWFFWSGRRLTK